MTISKRIKSIEISKSVEMAQKIIELRDQGHKVISFNVGEPDLSTPPSVIKATKDALDRGLTTYASVPGEPYLREALAQRINKHHQTKLVASNIALSNGSKQILYSIFQMICNPGDEVLVPKPYWVTFPEAIKLAGATPIFLEPTADQLVDLDEVARKLSPKTKAIIINCPNNPSGAIEPKETMAHLSTLCRERNLTLISDEAYEGILFDDHELTSPISFDKSLDHTLIVQTFSKSFSMTGFRLGHVAASQNFIKSFSAFQSHVCGNMPPFIQAGAYQALQIEDDLIKERKEIYQKRRDLAYKLCCELFSETPEPSGAFYLYPRLSESLLEKYGSDVKLAMHILEQAKVALLPGTYFGQSGYLRLCFATSEEEIKQGFQAIKDVL
jgi:aspartate aminotransferase